MVAIKTTSTEELDRTFPEVKPGTIVRVHQEITELNPKGEEKKRIQIFEGTVLERKHGQGIGATITVYKISEGVGVEKIFPLFAPTVKQIEVVQQNKASRAKLDYLRRPHKRMQEVK